MGNGKTERNSLDAFITSRKKQCEKTLTLRTVYPYGLNDLQGHEYKKSDTRLDEGNKPQP